MQNKTTTGSILAIVGGLGLAISAFLTWGTVTLDPVRFATALGVDPTTIPAGSMPAVSQSVTGTDGWEGKLAIAAGVAAIVLAVLAMRRTRRGLGVFLIVAGLVGGGVALYDVVTVNDQKNAAIQDAAPDLQSLGVQPSQLSEAIDVSLDAGIWLCVIAGTVVAAGGVLVRAGEGEGSSAPSSSGLGVGVGSALGTAPPPSAAPSPPAPAPPPVQPAPPAPGGAMKPPNDAGPDTE
jgi:hypothetical protein